jgi:hypothetical protein
MAPIAAIPAIGQPPFAATVKVYEPWVRCVSIPTTPHLTWYSPGLSGASLTDSVRPSVLTCGAL